MINISKELCIGCGKCVDDCVSVSLYLDDYKAAYTGKCIHCGHCVAVCPTNAVEIPEYDMDDVQEFSDMKSSLHIDSLLNTIKSRRTIRHYRDKKIEDEKIDNIIQAGRYTATAVNYQSSKFIIVQNQLDSLKDIIWEDLEKAINDNIEEVQPFKKFLSMKKDENIDFLFRNAPAVVYIAAKNLWDAGLAAQNIELAAVSQGLGIMYNGYLSRLTGSNEKALDFLHTEGKPIAVCMLLGYPDVKYLRTAPRKKANVLKL